MVTRERTSYVLAQAAVKADAQQTRAERIRGLLEAAGVALSPGAFYDKYHFDVFTTDELAALARSGALKIIRDAWSAKDAGGLPFAGPTTGLDDDGQHGWAQRTLWAFDDYELNVMERVSQRDGEHVTAVRLANECERRHHQVIKIPPLPSRKSIV